MVSNAKLRRWAIAFLLGLSLVIIGGELLIEKIAIFGFHDIVDVDNPQQELPQRPEFAADYRIDQFEELLRELVERGYWFLSSQDLYNYYYKQPVDPLPIIYKTRPKVMITIDDGYRDAHLNVLPLLERLYRETGEKITVVWFVNSSFMGVPGTYLEHASCEELREGVMRGYYDIQSHGANHENLTLISDEDVDKEVRRSQQELRDCLAGLEGTETVANHLSYPFGAIDDNALEIVETYHQSGYLYNTRSLRLTPFRNPYFIPRQTVNRNTSVGRLLRLAAGGWF
ncbi:MAG: polysaccharide deacetylase family protein [Phormidium sp.]